MFLLITLVSQAPAQTVTLVWDQNLEPDVTGYKIYYRTDSPTFPFMGTTLTEGASPILVKGSATTALTLNLPEDGSLYYFTATAVNSSQIESAFSDIVASDWVPYLLAPTGNAAIGTTANFVWEQPPATYNVSFDLLYGTDPNLNDKSLATVAPVTFNFNWPERNMSLVLPLAILLSLLMIARVGRTKRIWHTVRVGLCIGVFALQASCGGGGGGGGGDDMMVTSDASTPTTSTPTTSTPTTSTPTTSTPTTSIPTTSIPTTSIPTTSIPTTSTPTTSTPTTSIPTTSIPTTSTPDQAENSTAGALFTNVVTDINDTQFQVAGLQAETQYYWKIVAVDNWGNRYESLTQEFTTLAQ